MNKLLTILFLTLATLLTGCMGTFNYKDSPAMTTVDHQYPITIAVETFYDARPSKGGSGKMQLSYLPLMPYDWGYYNKPEDGKIYLSISSFKFYPTIDLARAATISLKHADIFKDVYQVTKYSDFKPDFIFSGTIYLTLHDQKVFTYCLSAPGCLLQFIGAPAGWTEATIEIEFFLKERATNKLAWHYRSKKSDTTVHWFYYQGQDVKDFSRIYQRIMNDAVKDLASTLKHNPALIPPKSNKKVIKTPIITNPQKL